MVEALRADFRHFEDPSAGIAHAVAVEVGPVPPAPRDGLWRAFRVREGLCRGWGARRRVDYDDGSRIETDLRARTTRVRSSEPARARELAYLYVLSRAGELLDLEGLHRAHALGLRDPATGATALLLMPSGTGKSTLALALRGLPELGLELLSDEIPLLDRRARLHPFPIRAAASRETLERLGWPEIDGLAEFRRRSYAPKRLIDLAELAPLGTAGPLAHVLVCRRDPSLRTPVLRPCDRARTLAALAHSMAIGVGVPQMAEHLLRPGPAGLARLAGIAASRGWAALRAVSRADAHELILAHDPEAALRAVAALLRSGRANAGKAEGGEASSARPALASSLTGSRP